MTLRTHCRAAAVMLILTAAFAQGASAASGLPSDFPLHPGLSPCKPVVMSKEVMCEWHNVDRHAMYVF